MQQENERNRPRAILLCLAVALVLAGFLPSRAAAQVLYGSVVGTVTDQTGALVPKAAVTITNVNTGQTREGTTDDAGYYSIPNVLEGRYDLSVKMALGFAPTWRRESMSLSTRSRASTSTCNWGPS